MAPLRARLAERRIRRRTLLRERCAHCNAGSCDQVRFRIQSRTSRRLHSRTHSLNSASNYSETVRQSLLLPACVEKAIGPKCNIPIMGEGGEHLLAAANQLGLATEALPWPAESIALKSYPTLRQRITAASRSARRRLPSRRARALTPARRLHRGCRAVSSHHLSCSETIPAGSARSEPPCAARHDRAAARTN